MSIDTFPLDRVDETALFADEAEAEAGRNKKAMIAGGAIVALVLFFMGR